MDEILGMEWPGRKRDVFRQTWVKMLNISTVIQGAVCARGMVHTVTIKRR